SPVRRPESRAAGAGPAAAAGGPAFRCPVGSPASAVRPAPGKRPGPDPVICAASGSRGAPPFREAVPAVCGRRRVPADRGRGARWGRRASAAVPRNVGGAVAVGRGGGGPVGGPGSSGRTARPGRGAGRGGGGAVCAGRRAVGG